MSRSPTEHTSNRTPTTGTPSVVHNPSRSSTADMVPQSHPAGGSLRADSVPNTMSPTIPTKAPGSKRTFSNASLSRYWPVKSGNRPQVDTSYQRNASEASTPIDYTGFPKSPSVLSDLTLSTSGSSSYSSGDPPRLELDFFTTSPTDVAEAEALGIALHASPLSVDSRRLGAIQEATLSPHPILNIVDGVVESGTLEGLVQHLIKRFGEQ